MSYDANKIHNFEQLLKKKIVILGDSHHGGNSIEKLLK